MKQNRKTARKHCVCHSMTFGIAVLFFLLLNPLFAQSIKKDSLLLGYKKFDNGTYSNEKISLLNELAKTYRFRNPDSLKRFADELLSIGLKSKDNNIIALGKLRVGNYYSDIGKNKKALKHYFEAEELLKEVAKPKLKIDVYTQLSMEFYFTRQLGQVLESAYKGIDLAQRNSLLSPEARLRHILGFIYTQNKLYDEAEIELLKAISLWGKVGDSLNFYGSKSNLARNSILAGDLEKAEQYFSGNLEFFNKSGEILWLARSYLVQSLILRKKNQLQKALASNQKYDSLLGRLKNPRDRILTYNLYSRLYQLSGNHEKAKKYADSTVHFSLQLKDSVELLNGYEALSEMAIENSDYREAAKYSSLALPIREILNKRFKEDNLKLLRTKHELEYDQLEKTLRDGQKLIRQRRITTILTLLSIFLLSALLLGRKIVRKRKNVNAELQELNQTKNKLFSIIGHDLKSPIGTLQELLELQSSEAISAEDIKKAIPRLKKNVDHSAFTLNNLLFWAKTQMNGLTPHPEKVLVKEKANAICEMYRYLMEKKNISVQCEISKNLEVWADPLQLEIIIRNIVLNAIKFTPDDGKIMFKSYQENKMAVISICDNGKGMDKTTVDLLLKSRPIEPTPGTHKEKGTGLGLMISKELIELNQGQLSIESKIGGGSCFRVWLPYTNK